MAQSTDDILIMAVDQPRPSSVIRELISYHRSSAAPITVPQYNGVRGHPLLFRRDLLGEISDIDEESLGLRGVLKKWDTEIAELNVGSPIVLADLNTPAQYSEAEKLFKNL